MKEIGWGDTSVEAISNTEFSERNYGLENGRIDVIRILSKCVEFKRYWIPEKQLYIVAPDDDTFLTQRGYQGKKSWAAKIIHIASIKGKNISKIGLTKVWMFSDPNKYIQLREINEAYGDITGYEIRLTCTDTKFQRLGSIVAIKDKTKQMIEKSMVEDAKANKEILQKFLKSKTKKEILESLDATATDEDAEDLLGEEEPKQKSKIQSKKQEIPKGKNFVEKDELIDSSDNFEEEVDALLE